LSKESNVMLSWLSGLSVPHPQPFGRPHRVARMPPRRKARLHRSSPGHAGMVWIPSGGFMMGSDNHHPEEAPAHPATVDGYWIDRYPVTNLEFDHFVRATGHVTLAERKRQNGEVGSLVFRKPGGLVNLSNDRLWWHFVTGADWRHPSGSRSGLEGKSKHPVVHVGYEDAQAYARWAGKDLPTEAEWEYAARGGLEGAEFAWGSELMPAGYLMANIWQGEFPWQNLTCGGFEGTSPVGFFPPNNYGLYDVIGNVWEWTADPYASPQTMASDFTPHASGWRSGEGGLEASGFSVPRKVMKGGSFLSAPNYCQRYRPAARMGQSVESTSCHLGFRCVARRSEHLTAQPPASAL
jgi:sulfatase modifying factor 1